MLWLWWAHGAPRPECPPCTCRRTPHLPVAMLTWEPGFRQLYRKGKASCTGHHTLTRRPLSAIGRRVRHPRAPKRPNVLPRLLDVPFPQSLPTGARGAVHAHRACRTKGVPAWQWERRLLSSQLLSWCVVCAALSSRDSARQSQLALAPSPSRGENPPLSLEGKGSTHDLSSGEHVSFPEAETLKGAHWSGHRAAMSSTDHMGQDIR